MPKSKHSFLWGVIPKMQRSIFPDKMQQNIFMDNIQRDNKTTRQLDNDTTTTTRQWQPIPTNGSDNTCLHLRSPKSQKHCFLVEVSGKIWMKILNMDHFCQIHPHKTENLVFFSPFVCNFTLDYSYAAISKVGGFTLYCTTLRDLTDFLLWAFLHGRPLHLPICQ